MFKVTIVEDIDLFPSHIKKTSIVSEVKFDFSSDYSDACEIIGKIIVNSFGDLTVTVDRDYSDGK